MSYNDPNNTSSIPPSTTSQQYNDVNPPLLPRTGNASTGLGADTQTSSSTGAGAPYTTTTETTTTTHHKPGLGGQIKGAAATVHGIGEAFRGAFNSEVDRLGGSPQQSGYAKNKAVEEKGLNEIRQRQFQHGTAGSTAATGAGYSGSMAGGPGAVDDRKVGTATGTGGGVYEKPVTRSASGAAGTGTTGGVPVQGNVMNAGVSEPGVGRRGAY